MNTLETIERLVAENSRLHKELQQLRTGIDVNAYTAYRDAGSAYDELRSMGFGNGRPDATLNDLVGEVIDEIARQRRYVVDTKAALDFKNATEEAVFKVSFGQDCQEPYKRHSAVLQVSKLRATLELIKVRLERIEKEVRNEDLNQLHFDLERFLAARE